MNIYTVELTEDLQDFLYSSLDYCTNHITVNDWVEKKYVAIKTYKEQNEWLVTKAGRLQPYQYWVKPCNAIQGFLVSYEDFMALELMPTYEARTEYLHECRRQYKANLVVRTPYAQ